MNGQGWLVALAASAMVVMLATPVSAQQSSDDQARLHYQVAASYYEQADYESALREFQSAYRLSQRPQLFFNISLCYQQLENLDEAISYLERYLNDVSDIENRPSLEQRLGNLRARRDAQSTTTTTTDPQDTAPPDAAIETPDVSPPPPTTGDSTNVPAIVGFSIAGVGLIAGAIFTGLLFAEDGRVGALPCAGPRTCPSNEVSALGTYALVSDISWGVSLAGAIVGTVFLFVPTSSSASADTASLRVSPMAGQVNGVLLSGAF